MNTTTTSLVICTYNWKEALRLVLLSAARQTVSPKEIVIADDGSRQDTRDTIESMRNVVPCPIKHVWHEDKGFRRAMIMNRAFAECTGEYIIQIDGDIIMDIHFIEDHLGHAEPGFYLSGSRAKLTKTLTDRLCAGSSDTQHWWSAGVTRRLNAVRMPWLSPLFYGYKKNGLDRGCNLSFWRKDLYAVNGYDNRMVGYGSEDTDLTGRIRRLGIKKRFVKFCCIEYHLYHNEHPTKYDTAVRQHNVGLRERHEAGGVIMVGDGIFNNN